MIPKTGQIYRKHITTNTTWRLERRLILDATDTQVFYEELFNDPIGITVEDDPIPHQKQIGIKAWRLWARTATLEGV